LEAQHCGHPCTGLLGVQLDVGAGDAHQPGDHEEGKRAGDRNAQIDGALGCGCSLEAPVDESPTGDLRAAGTLRPNDGDTQPRLSAWPGASI
jgi:hypothetical protein